MKKLFEALHFLLPPQSCPYCGRLVGCTAKFNGGFAATEKTTIGDVTVCAECLGLMIYGAKGELRTLSLEELCEVKDSPAWPRVLEVRKFFGSKENA